jgi:hypothetical protein
MISNRLCRSIAACGLACAWASIPAAGAGQQKPPAPQAPAAPQPMAGAKVQFSSPAGMLLVPIKPAETAVFEEMMARLHAGLMKTEDAALKQQGAGFAVYKVAEPFATNIVYVVRFEPAVPNVEYDLFDMLERTMTAEEKKAPGVEKMWDRYAAAFATGYNRLSLSPVDLPKVLEKLEGQKKDPVKK